MPPVIHSAWLRLLLLLIMLLLLLPIRRSFCFHGCRPCSARCCRHVLLHLLADAVGPRVLPEVKLRDGQPGSIGMSANSARAVIAASSRNPLPQRCRPQAGAAAAHARLGGAASQAGACWLRRRLACLLRVDHLLVGWVGNLGPELLGLQQVQEVEGVRVAARYRMVCTAWNRSSRAEPAHTPRVRKDASRVWRGAGSCAGSSVTGQAGRRAGRSHYKLGVLRLLPVLQVLQVPQECLVLKVAVLGQPCAAGVPARSLDGQGSWATCYQTRSARRPATASCCC
jgi:hypothetical protein